MKILTSNFTETDLPYCLDCQIYLSPEDENEIYKTDKYLSIDCPQCESVIFLAEENDYVSTISDFVIVC